MKQSIQERQDAIFRKMSVEQKIHLMSQFYRLAQKLQKIGRQYESRSTPLRSRRRS